MLRARARARRGCRASSRTASYLARILAHPAFRAGELDTHFLEQHAGELARAAARPRSACASPRSPRRSPASPHAAIRTSSHRRAGATSGSRTSSVTYQARRHATSSSAIAPTGGGFEFAIGGKTTHVSRYGSTAIAVVRRARRSPPQGARDRAAAHACTCSSKGASIALHRAAAVPRSRAPGRRGRARRADAGQGRQGPRRRPAQEVAAGAPLVVLEAMKMEHTVRAAEAGIVRDAARRGRRSGRRRSPARRRDLTLLHLRAWDRSRCSRSLSACAGHDARRGRSRSASRRSHRDHGCPTASSRSPTTCELDVDPDRDEIAGHVAIRVPRPPHRSRVAARVRASRSRCSGWTARRDPQRAPGDRDGGSRDGRVRFRRALVTGEIELHIGYAGRTPARPGRPVPPEGSRDAGTCSRRASRCSRGGSRRASTSRASRRRGA